MLKGYDVQGNIIWDKRLDLDIKTLKSKEILFYYLRSPLSKFLCSDGDCYIINKKYLNKFKRYPRLDGTYDYFYLSPNFNNEVLFYLLDHWVVPNRSKRVNFKH